MFPSIHFTYFWIFNFCFTHRFLNGDSLLEWVDSLKKKLAISILVKISYPGVYNALSPSTGLHSSACDGRVTLILFNSNKNQ
jgi:hypothetical protein